MNYVDSINRIVEEYKKQLGINGEIKVKIRSYRTKAAFVNLKTRTIYINGRLLNLDEGVVKYLILHELLHIKLNSKYHSRKFYELLYGHISPEEVELIRKTINEGLKEINHLRDTFR